MSYFKLSGVIRGRRNPHDRHLFPSKHPAQGESWCFRWSSSWWWQSSSSLSPPTSWFPPSSSWLSQSSSCSSNKRTWLQLNTAGWSTSTCFSSFPILSWTNCKRRPLGHHRHCHCHSHCHRRRHRCQCHHPTFFITDISSQWWNIVMVVCRQVIVINSAMNMIITTSLSWQPGWLDRLENLDLALDLKPEVFFSFDNLIIFLQFIPIFLSISTLYV